jgi:hypothetical protein
MPNPKCPRPPFSSCPNNLQRSSVTRWVSLERSLKCQGRDAVKLRLWDDPPPSSRSLSFFGGVPPMRDRRDSALSPPLVPLRKGDKRCDPAQQTSYRQGLPKPQSNPTFHRASLAPPYRRSRRPIRPGDPETIPPVPFGKEGSNLHRLIQSQVAFRLADSRVKIWSLVIGHWSLANNEAPGVSGFRSSTGSGIRTPVAWLEARSRAARPIPRQ